MVGRSTGRPEAPALQATKQAPHRSRAIERGAGENPCEAGSWWVNLAFQSHFRILARAEPRRNLPSVDGERNVGGRPHPLGYQVSFRKYRTGRSSRRSHRPWRSRNSCSTLLGGEGRKHEPWVRHTAVRGRCEEGLERVADYSEATLHLDRLNSTSRSTQSDQRPGHLGTRWLASKNAFQGLK